MEPNRKRAFKTTFWGKICGFFGFHLYLVVIHVRIYVYFCHVVTLKPEFDPWSGFDRV